MTITMRMLAAWHGCRPVRAGMMFALSGVLLVALLILAQTAGLCQRPQEGTVPLPQLVALAIDVEAAGGWDTAAGKEALAKLAASPGQQERLAVVRRLLRGETTALANLFADRATSPPPREMSAAIKLLRDGGYALPADILTVAGPGLPGICIDAWLVIPPAQRGPIDAYMDTRYPVGDPNRIQWAEQALELFLRPPAQLRAPPQDCLALALRLGKGTRIESLETAQQLLQTRKIPEAQALIKALAAARPTDARLQVDCARKYAGTGSADGTVALYAEALKTVPEPETRLVRQQFVQFLQFADRMTGGKGIADDPVVPSSDPLFVADRLVATGKRADARDRYQVLVVDAAQPLGRRLDAWAGLWRCDPAAALPHIEPLVQAMAQVAAPERGRLALWTGKEVWSLVDQAAQGQGGLSAVPNWETRVADLLARLVAMDPATCLPRAGEVPPVTLRTPMAVCYGLARQPEQAAEILYRRVEYVLDTPPGGWTEASPADKQATPGAPKSRTLVSPTAWEMGIYPGGVVQSLSRYPQAPERASAVGAALAHGLVTLIGAAPRDEDAALLLKPFAQVVQESVNALDPLPAQVRAGQPAPVNEVDLARFAPVAQAVREAIALDRVMQDSEGVFPGLTAGLRTARNPQLQEALFALVLEALARKAAVSGPEQATRQAGGIIRQIAPRRDLDLRPLADRLREKYPQPEMKVPERPVRREE